MRNHSRVLILIIARLVSTVIVLFERAARRAPTTHDPTHQNEKASKGNNKLQQGL